MKVNIFHSILFFLMVSIGCKNDDRYKENCINYIDSLRIDLVDSHLRVAIIQPQLNNLVRPYAFIYQNHLIVLNKIDSFYSFTMDCFERDTVFEKRLNTVKFKNAFILGDSLYGIDGNKVSYLYNESKKKWIKANISSPFDNEPPIYEDEKYICYSVCHGEFGGVVFFYNKISHRTTFFPSQCTVCVMKKKDGYILISNLSHGFGASSIVGINNPDSLYKFPEQQFASGEWKEMGEQKIYELIKNDTLVKSQFSVDFEGTEKLVSSGFVLGDNYYFLTQISYDKTCLSKLKYDSIGNVLKKEISFQLPPALPQQGYMSIVFRDDELDTIPVADVILENLPASSGEITREMEGVTIINYTNFANDKKDLPEYSHRNLLVTTFIQRDSSLIRINWPRAK